MLRGSRDLLALYGKRYKAGDSLALIDATELLSLSPNPGVPDWYWEAVIEMALSQFKNRHEKERRGRTANEVARLSANLLHSKVWLAVQGEKTDGVSLNKAYARAKEVLGQQGYARSIEAVRRSYALVERARAERSTRFLFSSNATLKQAGVERTRSKSGKK